MTYAERLKHYCEERDQLLRSVADLPYSEEIKEQFAALAKKWEV